MPGVTLNLLREIVTNVAGADVRHAQFIISPQACESAHYARESGPFVL